MPKASKVDRTLVRKIHGSGTYLGKLEASRSTANIGEFTAK
jgi:hypothetical protein